MNFKAFIFDLDGTIYLSERLILGADDVIRALRERGRRVVFLSNKPTDTRETYAAKLTRLGIPAAPEDVINSSLIAARYLGRRMPGARLHVIGEPPLVLPVAVVPRCAGAPPDARSVAASPFRASHPEWLHGCGGRRTF